MSSTLPFPLGQCGPAVWLSRLSAIQPSTGPAGAWHLMPFNANILGQPHMRDVRISTPRVVSPAGLLLVGYVRPGCSTSSVTEHCAHQICVGGPPRILPAQSELLAGGQGDRGHSCAREEWLHGQPPARRLGVVLGGTGVCLPGRFLQRSGPLTRCHRHPLDRDEHTVVYGLAAANRPHPVTWRGVAEMGARPASGALGPV